MENYKKTDALVSFVAECCYQFGKENKLDSFDFFQEIAGVAHDVFTKTESVPEYLFATDLLTLFCQLHIGVMQGTMTEKELKECEEDLNKKSELLEIFINPNFLFEEGKIRPDMVFRKGLGNYLIFEIDSFLYHSSQEQLLRDKQRERKIESLGYPVFRFAAKEVLQGHAWNAAVEAVKILEKKGFIETKNERIT